jgi:hypothetical protein
MVYCLGEHLYRGPVDLDFARELLEDILDSQDPADVP